MKMDSLNALMIVVDSKNSRIRIHRSTLHFLGDPEYIQLLVNPKQLTLAILSSPQIRTANAVRWDRMAENKCCELYSKILVRQLGIICPGWKADGKYRLYGVGDWDRKMIRFDMSSAEEMGKEGMI